MLILTAEESQKKEVQSSEEFADSIVQAVQEKLREEAMAYIIKEAAIKISRYVQLMKRPYKLISGVGLLVLDKIDSENVEIMIVFRPPEWIEMRAMAASANEISVDAARECRVYENLLRLSHDFPELTFALDPQNNIIAKQSILVGALSYDVFREEYDGILASILLFRRKLLPALKKCIKDYEEIKDALEIDIT